MSSFTDPLRRNAVTIGLSLFIALGVAWYVLGYLPSREQQLRARYFRVMERIGANMQEKTRAFGKRSEAMVREIRFNIGKQSTAIAPLATGAQYRYVPVRLPAALARRADILRFVATKLSQQWERDSLNSPKFDTVRRVFSSHREPLQEIKYANQRLQFIYDFEDSLRIATSSHIQDFTQGLLRPDAFEHFLIIGASSADLTTFDQLYYHSFPAPSALHIPGGGKGKPSTLRWLRDTTGMQAPRLVDLTIGGKPYKLFIQPVRMSASVTWLLGGAISADAFNAQRRELPENLVEVILAVILVGMLALPFLKITLMSARERLCQSDVILCGVSLVLGTSFLLLLSLQLVAKHGIEPSLLKSQLAALAKQVDGALHQELRTIDALLLQADQTVMNRNDLQSQLAGRTSLTDSSLTAKIAPSAVFATTRSRSGPPRPWRKEDQILWINAAGNGVLSLDSTADWFLPNLQRRAYFQQWQARQLWQLPAPAATRRPAAPFALESVVTFGRSGDKIAIYARPSKLTPAAAGLPAPTGKPAAMLTIYNTHLRSLSNPILPPGYQFCVVDAAGEIKFHSEARLDLSENILNDCEPAGTLRAAMFARDTAALQVQYQGRDYMLRIQPLQDWPLYLVTLADLHMVHAKQMQTLSLAATLLTAFSVLSALFLALYVVVLPSRHTVLTISYSLRRLWPRVSHTLTYLQIVGALLGGGLLLFAVTCYAGPLVQLLLLPLVPVYAFLFSFYKLRLPTDNLTPPDVMAAASPLRVALNTLRKASGGLGQVLRLTLAFLLIYNGIAWYWTQGEWGWGLLLQAGLLALLLALPSAGRWLEKQRHMKAHLATALGTYSSPMFRRAYTTMLLSWIMMLSIVPAVYCYQTAYRAERELQIRYAHFQLARAQRQNTRQLITYARFFFNTTATTAPAPGPVSEAENNYRELVTWLHPGFDGPSRLMQRVLPRGARFNDWTVTFFATGATRLSSDFPPPHHQQHFVSSIDDRSLGQHWYLPTAVVKQEAGYQAGLLPGLLSGWGRQDAGWSWVRMVVGMGLLLLSLYYLLYLLARRVFNLDMLDLKTLVYNPALHRHSRPAARYEYRLCATESQYQVPVPLADTSVHLDCRELALTEAIATTMPPAWKKKCRAADATTTIALDYFDHQAHNTALTQLKIEVLTYLQQCLRCKIIIASRVHPVVFADCGHTHDTCDDKEHHKLIWQTGDALLDALADFQLVYSPMKYAQALQPYVYWDGMKPEKVRFERKLGLCPKPTDAQRREAFVHLRWFAKVECAALPFLGPTLERELDWLLVEGFHGGESLDEDDIILSIQQRAQFHFRQLWASLTTYEHYVLYDVAQDGLVNSRDAQVINDLLQKSLLTYNQAGLRLVNESFRYFILNGLPPQQALRIEHEAAQEAERDGTWARRSLPIFLTLSAAGLFIFVTQRSILTEAQTFLTALTATLPLLYRFVSLTPFGSSAPAPAKPPATA